MKLAHIPLRVATGAYILNSGLSKQGLEGQAAEGLHGMATNAIPALKKIPPEQFGRISSTGEIAWCGAADPVRALSAGWSRLGRILRWAGSAVPEDARHAARGQRQTYSGRARPRKGCVAARLGNDVAP